MATLAIGVISVLALLLLLLDFVGIFIFFL
jgi:hypothetical protein